VGGLSQEKINNKMPQNVTFMSCTSPTFPFQTDVSEYLKLPKSTLQTQFAHGAKSDLESDFKFETEYLLDCSIPNKPPHEPVFLEECLSEYFTNIVQVRRQLSTPGDMTPGINYHTKPRLSTGSSYSPGPSTPGSPPPYTGDGNGFYGVDEKAALKKSFQEQERNVAAWQVRVETGSH
jgi:hypothetical protein